MDLFGEKPAKLLSKLVTTSVQPIDVDNFVYHIPGIEAYGEWLVLFSSFQKLIDSSPTRSSYFSHTELLYHFGFFVVDGIVVIVYIVLLTCHYWPTGSVSAIAALDGRHYNTLRSRLHSVANKVSTRITVAGFSVSLLMLPVLAEQLFWPIWVIEYFWLTEYLD